MATTNDTRGVPVRELVLVPAIITLAVTLIRLAGERMGGSDTLFNRSAGGAGALIGIVWLVPIFGYWFGHRLTRAGFGPASLGRFYAFTVLGLVVMAGLTAAAFALSAGSVLQIVLVIIGSWAGALLVRYAWPALGTTLIAYGLAARIPVALIMLAAILGDWGTHYDVAPPGFPEGVGKVEKWVRLGLVPQLTVWIGFTVIVGALLAGIAVAVARRRGASTAAAA